MSRTPTKVCKTLRADIYPIATEDDLAEVAAILGGYSYIHPHNSQYYHVHLPSGYTRVTKDDMENHLFGVVDDEGRTFFRTHHDLTSEGYTLC